MDYWNESLEISSLKKMSFYGLTPCTCQLLALPLVTNQQVNSIIVKAFSKSRPSYPHDIRGQNRA